MNIKAKTQPTETVVAPPTVSAVFSDLDRDLELWVSDGQTDNKAEITVTQLVTTLLAVIASNESGALKGMQHTVDTVFPYADCKLAIKTESGQNKKQNTVRGTKYDSFIRIVKRLQEKQESEKQFKFFFDTKATTGERTVSIGWSTKAMREATEQAGKDADKAADGVSKRLNKLAQDEQRRVVKSLPLETVAAAMLEYMATTYQDHNPADVVGAMLDTLTADAAKQKAG